MTIAQNVQVVVRIQAFGPSTGRVRARSHEPDSRSKLGVKLLAEETEMFTNGDASTAAALAVKRLCALPPEKVFVIADGVPMFDPDCEKVTHEAYSRRALWGDDIRSALGAKYEENLDEDDDVPWEDGDWLFFTSPCHAFREALSTSGVILGGELLAAVPDLLAEVRFRDGWQRATELAELDATPLGWVVEPDVLDSIAASM